jgi:phage virion morphogenesis protein
MTRVRIDIDSAELEQALDRLFRAVLNTRPLFASLGELALLTVRGYFDEQREPDGTPWQELSPPYLEYKRKKGFRTAILQKRGVLFKSITYAASREEVVVGTNLVYGRIHQFGGDIERQGVAGAYTITLPPRPYLNLGDDPAFVEAATTEIEDYLVGAWDG